MLRLTLSLCVIIVLPLGGHGKKTEPPFVHYDYFLPQDRASVMQEHLRLIVARGWGTIGPGELYHGHVLLTPVANRIEYFDSMQQLFSYSPGVLYHSDELQNRWQGTEGTLPPLQRTPRSFIGYWDGRLEPATALFREPVKTAPDFAKYGTIHESDLAHEHPDQFADHLIRDVTVRKGMCRTHLQFAIIFGKLPAPVITVGGETYTVSLPCLPH